MKRAFDTAAGRSAGRFGRTVPWLLAGATVVWTLVAPASLPRSERQPPEPLPARMDPGFVADLAVLRTHLPRAAVVVVDPGESRSRIASWYWTMAAFTVPESRFVLAGRAGREAADPAWLVGPAAGPAPPGWSRLGCGAEWCLWRR